MSKQEFFSIRGGIPLRGEVKVSGGKNAADGDAGSGNVIYEETISPNEAYVENDADKVFYTVTVYQEDGGVRVASTSNAAFARNMSYEVKTAEPVTKNDVAVQWQTAMGSPTASQDDEFAVAVVTITAGGAVVSEQKISFIGGAVESIADAVGGN